MIRKLLARMVKENGNPKDPAVRLRYGTLCGWIGIVLNVLLFAAKFLVGFLAGSVAICADAFNNLTDAASSIIGLLGFRLSKKPADAEHPYGHGRYEYLSGLAVCVLIFVIGFELLKTSFGKILAPTTTVVSSLTVWVMAIAIVGKLFLSYINFSVGRRIDSKTLIATAKDSRNDVISTAAVLASMILTHFTDWNIDGYVGVAIALFILYSALGLLKEMVYPLLGAAPDPEWVAQIRADILGFEGVLGTHDLMVHDYGPGRSFASVHIEMAAEQDVLECHDIIDNIEQFFLQERGLHLIVHYDPIVTDDPTVQDLRHQLQLIVEQIHQKLSIHDLRVVFGNSHTNLVFDCVIPMDV